LIGDGFCEVGSGVVEEGANRLEEGALLELEEVFGANKLLEAADVAKRFAEVGLVGLDADFGANILPDNGEAALVGDFGTGRFPKGLGRGESSPAFAGEAISFLSMVGLVGLVDFDGLSTIFSKSFDVFEDCISFRGVFLFG
jgi:hypothetical protein